MTAVDRVVVTYAKVSTSHLVQLEIHVLGITEEDGVDAAAWFDETKHVQEITDTLMPVMQVRVANWCNKEGDKRSTTAKEAAPLHVEGDSLRLSYRFCRRSLSHQCVIINCTDRHLRRKQRRSLVVFTEKLVVHVYHLAGYNRLKSFAKGSKQTSLNFKAPQKRLVSNGEVNKDSNNSNNDVTIPSTSMAMEWESSKTSLYFDGEVSSTQPQKRILRNIVKKSRPKLSKSSGKEKEQEELEQEDQGGTGKYKLSSRIAETVTLDADESGPGEDNLSSHMAETITLDEDQGGTGKYKLSSRIAEAVTLDDDQGGTGKYKLSSRIAETITLDDDQGGTGKYKLSSRIAEAVTLDADESGPAEDNLSSRMAETITLDADESGPGKDMLNSHAAASKTLDPLIAIQDSGIGRGDTTTADLTDMDKSHNTTTEEDVILMEKSHNTTTAEDVILVDKSHKLQKSSTFSIIRDSDDVDSSLSTRHKTKRHGSKAGHDKTEVEVQLVDVEKGQDRAHAKELSAKQQGLTLGSRLNERDSGQSDGEPAVHLKSGRKEQRKLRLKRTTKPARPFTMPVSPDSSSCDSNSSSLWKVPLLSVAQQSTSFEKFGAEKPSQLEKLHRSATSGNPNSSGDSVLPISQALGTKSSITGNMKKAMCESSDSRISMKASKRKKASEKTSSKLATILKEMDDDILGNSSDTDYCRVAPSRARTVVQSDISLITRRDSLDFDPFVMRHTEKSGAERSGKANRKQAGGLLDGAVSELRHTKRRRLSNDDSHGSSPPKSLLGRSQETTSNNNTDDDLDEFGEDKHFEPGDFMSLPRNAIKHKRRQIDKWPTKSQSINYRISSERRKRLAAILNSDSDCDNVVINGNDGSAASRRSSSVGMVSQYFQRAMQSGSRSTTAEKISDKEEEDAEKVLIEDLFNDCFIDETKSTPVVVKVEVNAEITRIKRVCDLTEEQLLHLVNKNKYYLKNIFEGKAPCKRHSDYKKGGKTRLLLNYQVPLNLFQEEQPDTIVSALVGIFCRNTGSKYLDYLLKVLLPEILIKIYMDVHGTSREDAVEIMAHARPLVQGF